MIFLNMDRFEVRESSTTNKDWDELVTNSPQSTIFHTSDWINLISRNMRKPLQILQCYNLVSDPPQIVGGCAFLKYNRFFLRIALDHFDFTAHEGIILTSCPSKNQRKIESWQSGIISSFLDAFKSKKYDRVTFIHSPTLNDVRPFIHDGWNCEILYTYMLDLKNDFTQNISKEVKWSINKAKKSQISVYKIESPKPSDIYTYISLQKMTLQRQGFSLKYLFSHDFMKELLEILYKKEKGALWFAETKTGEIAAAEIILYDNKMAHRWSAASHTEYQNTGAVSYLLFEIAKYLQNERGYEKFNLMAANSPEISTFISQFNPQLIPYYSTTKYSKLYNIIFNASQLV